MYKNRKIFFNFIIFIFSFLFGAINAVESHFFIFATTPVDVMFSHKLVEKKYWENLSSYAIRYFPVLLIDWSKLKKKLEEEAPVYIFLKHYGFLKFKVFDRVRDVLIILKWKNDTFYVSDDGAMWFIEHPMNEEMGFFVSAKGVLWNISDSLPSPIQGDFITKYKIYSSTLPVTLLKYWKNCFDMHEWYKFAEDLLLERRAGEYVFRILLGRDLKGTVLILDGNVGKMNERIVAIDNVLRNVRGAAKKSIIDATYQDKIVVKSMSDDLE